jgi:hypothetical protein
VGPGIHKIWNAHSRQAWTDQILLKVEGTFDVTGPLETFSNAGD